MFSFHKYWFVIKTKQKYEFKLQKWLKMAVFAIFEALLSKNRKKQETFFVLNIHFL